MKQKRVIGFGTYNKQEPQEQEESKIDYVRMALDAYFEGDSPSEDQYEEHVDFLSSKDIQDAIKEMVNNKRAFSSSAEDNIIPR